MDYRAHFAAGAVAAGLLASTLGIWFVKAADEAKPVEKASPFAPGTTAATTAALSHPCGLKDPIIGVSVDELFRDLNEKHHVTIRLDPAVFLRKNGFSNPYELKLSIAVVKGLTLQDVLEEVLEQFEAEIKLGITVRGGQIILGRSFLTPSAPGGYKRKGGPSLMIPETEIARLLTGPTVNLAVKQQTLSEIAALLRESAGVNIVIDPAVKDAAEIPITVTFSDAKLMTVLKVAGDMCDLAPAVVDNVFYLTTKAKAAEWMSQTEKNLFGEPKAK